MYNCLKLGSKTEIFSNTIAISMAQNKGEKRGDETFAQFAAHVRHNCGDLRRAVAVDGNGSGAGRRRTSRARSNRNWHRRTHRDLEEQHHAGEFANQLVGRQGGYRHDRPGGDAGSKRRCSGGWQPHAEREHPVGDSSGDSGAQQWVEQLQCRFGALGPLTTGSSNTAVGDNALYLNTSGYENTATGTSALYSNTTGQGNTANGTFALSQNNGSQNTAMGVVVLNSNTTGNDNAAIGYYALENNSTGIFNTAGGATSNNIQIGNYGTAGDSGTIRIGIQGTQTSAFIAGIYGAATSANNAVPVLIDSTRNLGTISSSRRYKEDIQDMGDASSGLMRLRPVTFRYKKPFEDGSKPVQYGLIAEEVADVYPDLVTRSPDGQVETVKYQVLDPMLLNELQKQKAQIRSLEDRLARLEAALERTSLAASSR